MRSLCLLVVIVSTLAACQRKGKVMSDADLLAAETARRATAVGDQAIAAFLPTGAAAKARFSNRRLVEQKENFALVAATVEIPDGTGSAVRQDWCTVVKFQPPRGEDVVWSGQEGAWNCAGGIDPNVVQLQKAMIGWPGASDEVPGRSDSR